MRYYEVAPTKVARMEASFFTYASEQALEPGSLVRIPIGNIQQTGVVWREVTVPDFATKEITLVLESNPLPSSLLRLSEWLSEYYATHLAVVLQTVLPAGLHKKRRARTISYDYPSRKRTKIVLNDEQLAAIKTIETASSGTVLLKGVTGSGKTRVYIESAKKQAAAGNSSIVLVPEIALTPQLVAEFREDFPDEQLLITHSGMTEAERHLTWRTCLESDKPLVIIGPRSALFSPVKHLGLIVIDEAHEPSFKQDQAPRYNTIRAAAVLAHQLNIKLVIGSATPSISDYYLARETGRPIANLAKLAVKASLPSIELVSFLQRSNFSQHRFFSNQLLAAIRESLATGKQALLFHNRRGTAAMTLCGNCGWSALCPNCFAPLTLHTDQHELRCHICNYHQNVPHTCPVCLSPDIIHKGIGTKMIADELERLFPNIRIARFDADNAIDETLQANYQALYDGDIRIIVGTQLIAKGLDLPHLQTVGVVQADSGLFLPDYQAEERVFQLLYQVAGRVGRQSTHETKVIVQTYLPNHPVIHFGLQKNYDAFYDYAIEQRRRSLFPPFRFLLQLTCRYATEAAAVNAARTLASQIRTLHKDVEVLGPTPAFYERLGGKYRWQLIIKSQHRQALHDIALSVPKPWQIDLDPHDLL